jgi:hypothetical protein
MHSGFDGETRNGIKGLLQKSTMRERERGLIIKDNNNDMRGYKREESRLTKEEDVHHRRKGFLIRNAYLTEGKVLSRSRANVRSVKREGKPRRRI